MKLSSLGLEDEFHDNLSYVDDHLQEPKAVCETENIYGKKRYDGKVDLRGNKSRQDAEKLAIELLATR